MKSYSIQQINEIIQGELIGATDQQFIGPEQIEKAKPQHITFIGNQKYVSKWESSKAGAAIVNEKLNLEPKKNKAFIIVKNADLAMAALLELFKPSLPVFDIDIHPTAIIDKTATLGNHCKIGAGCYVGKNVVIGEGVTLFPNVTIMDDTELGDHCEIWSGTVIRERSVVGSNCIFHANVSIGSDGFGYRPSDDGKGLVKIPHIGNVIIGNHVEIGANSAVDRGKFSATIIGDGCKIDNLVQIAHNCVLGRSCILAGQSGLAGSVTLGDGVIIGGASSIKDHLTIESGAVIGGGSGVINDVKAGKTVVGYPAQDSREMFKQWVMLRKMTRNS